MPFESSYVTGSTTKTRDPVVYDRLFPTWVYLPVWWNCQEFAVRFAFLLVQTPWATERLVSITRQLKDEILIQAIASRKKWEERFKLVLKHVPIPVGPLRIVPDFMRHISDGFQGVDKDSVREWLGNIVKLGNEVEELRPFHRAIFEGWNTEKITYAR